MRRRRSFLPWVIATLTASTVLIVPEVIDEGEPGLFFVAPFLILPFALITTLPTLLVRAFMPETPQAWQMATAGAAFAVVAGLIPDFDIVDRSHFAGWLVIFAAGALAGLVWHFTEWKTTDA